MIVKEVAPGLPGCNSESWSVTLGSETITYRSFFKFRGIVFSNYYRKLYSMIFLGELITEM